MTRQEIFDQFVAIVKPFARSKAQPSIAISDQTILLDDLMINSARMVDIVLETEEGFGIAVDDDSMNALRTVGDAVDMILVKLSAQPGVRAANSLS